MQRPTSTPLVTAVSRSGTHDFSKSCEPSITLLAGFGVEGDAHGGATVKHRSAAARDKHAPNLRQVHLIHAELHAELKRQGYDVAPGQMGENITTQGIALLDLPTGTRLRLGAEAVVEVTGLRTPCRQLDKLQPGLMRAVFGKDERGKQVCLSGVMGIVVTGGKVAPGDSIQIEWPPEPRQPLGPV